MTATPPIDCTPMERQMTMTDTTTLNVEQCRRAEALDKARRVLTTKGFGSEGAADRLDLIEVATWIIDGRDPLDGYREPAHGLDDDTQLGSVTA